MRVSYLEIYNESVRDLLGKDQKTQLEVRLTTVFLSGVGCRKDV